MATVSDSWRRQQLREAKQNLRDAISKVDSAMGALSEVARDEEERDLCDNLEMASSDLTDAFDLFPDPDADDEEE